MGNVVVVEFSVAQWLSSWTLHHIGLHSQQGSMRIQVGSLAILFLLTTYTNAYIDLKEAVVKLVPGGDSGVAGVLHLTSSATNLYARAIQGVRIKGMITGLSPGHHGFHIHAVGDLGNDCKAAGGHFNPDEKLHAAPYDHHRHAGDLGNIVAVGKAGVAYISIDDHGAHAMVNNRNSSSSSHSSR